MHPGVSLTVLLKAPALDCIFQSTSPLLAIMLLALASVIGLSFVSAVSASQYTGCNFNFHLPSVLLTILNLFPESIRSAGLPMASMILLCAKSMGLTTCMQLEAAFLSVLRRIGRTGRWVRLFFFQMKAVVIIIREPSGQERYSRMERLQRQIHSQVHRALLRTSGLLTVPMASLLPPLPSL